ncbi:MAG: hypothetical protein JW776_07530 [Candidatus Lokiarchaeota archaeon]|nr:hypothetical protein [Candidatus Lokiarchaeota archaeon]
MKKRQVMSFVLLFLLLPVSNFWLNVSFAGATPQLEEEEPVKSFTPHSSPYYFKVNRTSPLLYSEEGEENENNKETLPESSQNWYSFQDYSLTLYLNKYAVIPGESIDLKLRLTKSFIPSEDNVITVHIYKGFYRYYNYQYSNYYNSELIFSDQFYTDDNGEVALTFSDTSDSGPYTVLAYYNDRDVSTYREFSVSETGIFLKGPMYYTENQNYHAAVHLVNISDFSPMPNHHYEYFLDTYDYNAEQWITVQYGEGQTDTYGYDIFHTDPILLFKDENYFGDSLRLTIESTEGSISYRTFLYQDWSHYYYTLWGGAQEMNYDKYQFVITTDKTIYSPGETIKLRALVFEYNYLNETRIPYSNQKVQLTIYNPSELAVFWTEIETDLEGVAIMEFPLDYETETGSFGFEFSIGEIYYLHSIRIDFYVKPVFRVSINTNGQEFYPKTRGLQKLYKQELFKGSVDVEYYFGQPVVDAEVFLTLKDYNDEIVYRVSGKTNGQGIFSFSIDLKWLEGIDWVFSAEAAVTDTYGRTADAVKKYTRNEELFAYGYLSDWAPSPNENLEYYFNVFQILSTSEWYYTYEYNPLANVTAKIRVYGVKEYPIYIATIRGRTLLGTYYSTTNEYGAGKLEFALPLEDVKNYNLFEIRLDIELEDGRSTDWFTYYRYRKYALDIKLLNLMLNPGDTLDFTANYVDALTQTAQKGEGRIYIYDAEYNLLGRAGFEIDGTRDFSITIPTFAPEGTYYLYSYVYSRRNDYYGGFLYHSVTKQFSVGTVNTIGITTNATIMTHDDSRIEVDLGDTLEICGVTNVSTNQPLYFEIYKRGILYSERLLIVEDQFTKNLPITSDLGPDFTIMIYTIAESGRLHEIYLIVHVEFESGFQISTDKEVYEPGDKVTLTITPNDDNPMLISTTFIDSAVLAVEPEEDSELNYFERSSYHAYIGSGSSWGSGVFWENYAWISYELPTGGFWFSPFYVRKLGGGWDEFSLFGLEGLNSPSLDDIVRSYDINIRKNITESANWIPSKVINGPTNFTFHLPDNIGEWTIRLVGNAIDETNILWGQTQTVEIKAFLPFFVEFEPPSPITQDEIVTLKAYIYNYAGTDLTADVIIDAPGFDILNNPTQNIRIPHNYVSEVEFTLYARDPFLHNITILALSEEENIIYSDAKQMQANTYPNGYEYTERFSAYVNQSMGSYVFNYTLDPSSIFHKETLSLFKDVMEISIEGWQSLVGYPHGCIEQTTSKLITTAMIYRYLNDIGQLTEALIEELIPMIMQGLSRVYNLQNTDGGWGWWGNGESNLQMTVITVFTLELVKLSGFELNDFVMFKAYNYVVSEQKTDGSWEYPYYSANAFEATIYTLRTLILSANKTSAMENAIQSGIDFLNADWLNVNHQSPYGAALYLISTWNTPYENDTIKTSMLSYLLAERKSTATTAYWENDAFYYWRNLGNSVEITAYATLALALEDYLGNYAIIQKAVKFLLDSKSTWGWWSTADSSAAIYTLTELTKFSESLPVLDFNGTVNISVNSKIPQIIYNLTDASYSPSSILTEISRYIVDGQNEINITTIGTGQLAFIFTSTQIIRYVPVINIPELIEINTDEFFNVTVDIDPFYEDLTLSEVSLSMINVPEIFQVSAYEYSKTFTTITEGKSVNFTLHAPSELGTYSVDGFYVSMLLLINSDLDDPLLYHKMIGPVEINVLEEDVSASISKQSPAVLTPLNSKSLSANLDYEIALQKEFSKTINILPRELVSVSLIMSNPNDSLQYFALDDSIPAGMILATDTIKVNGQSIESNALEITYQSIYSDIHFFIPLLPHGDTVITYNLLVDSVKNSIVPSSKLWGMYQNLTISSEPFALMNFPLLFYANQSIYRDLVYPSINTVAVSQIEHIEDVELNLHVEAFDNNQIYKVRFTFRQGDSWRSQTTYSIDDINAFDIIISGLENVDSKVHYFVEVQDVYGNIVASTIQTVIVYSTVIPYITIGIGIALAIALACVVTVLYKKKARDTTLKEISFSDESDPGPPL